MENRPLSQQLGDNVRRLRKDRGLSLAEVSSRMEALGVPLSLNGLSKVERGARGLDLDELTALSRALEVPPLLVILPIGFRPTVELLPDLSSATWPAAKWFTGEGPFPAADAAGARWNSPLRDFRYQDEVIEDWRRSRSGAERTKLERSLRMARDHIRSWGLDPGPLPAELAHAEEADDGER